MNFRNTVLCILAALVVSLGLAALVFAPGPAAAAPDSNAYRESRGDPRREDELTGTSAANLQTL